MWAEYFIPLGYVNGVYGNYIYNNTYVTYVSLERRRTSTSQCISINEVETTYLGSAEDMKLYRCWVEDYEVNESRHSRSVSHIREAEGSYGYESTPRLDQQQGNGNGRGGNGANPKPKPKPKAKKEKSEDQLCRAVD